MIAFKENETPSLSPQPLPTTSEGYEFEEDDVIMETFTTRTRCCFPCFGSKSSPSVWERLQHTAEMENPWWARPLRGLKKVREWSEIIAGPKWKTFIRRFNNKNGKNVKFQYDPLSYALNFDEGQGHNGHLDDDGGSSYFPDFSSRFASLPSSCKSSMDLGKTVILSSD